MSQAATIDAFECRITEAEASFAAEKSELLNSAHGDAAIQARRKYLKSIEMRLAEMHDQRRRLAAGMLDQTGCIVAEPSSALR